MTKTDAETNQHYDLDPRIFELFLDPLRKYSSGLYRSDADTLESAQVNKLHYVAKHLRLAPQRRLLDIGCGWGALLLFAAEHYQADVVGISPAPNQLSYIGERAAERGLAGRVETRLGHIENMGIEAGEFDAVSLLGSIVHMPDLDSVFATCWRALKRGGRLYVSESCYRNAARREEFSRREGSRFVHDSIFGWGDMRPLSDLVRGAEDAGFSIVGVDDLTNDYHRTIEAWRENVIARAPELEAMEPGLAERLRRYLEVANAGWGFTTKHYALICSKSR